MNWLAISEFIFRCFGCIMFTWENHMIHVIFFAPTTCFSTRVTKERAWLLIHMSCIHTTHTSLHSRKHLTGSWGRPSRRNMFKILLLCNRFNNPWAVANSLHFKEFKFHFNLLPKKVLHLYCKTIVVISYIYF